MNNDPVVVEFPAGYLHDVMYLGHEDFARTGALSLQFVTEKEAELKAHLRSKVGADYRVRVLIDNDLDFSEGWRLSCPADALNAAGAWCEKNLNLRPILRWRRAQP